MKRFCECIDSYISTKECFFCEEPCNNKSVLEVEDMIKNIYCILLPAYTFIDVEKAYYRIIEELNKD